MRKVRNVLDGRSKGWERCIGAIPYFPQVSGIYVGGYGSSYTHKFFQQVILFGSSKNKHKFQYPGSSHNPKKNLTRAQLWIFAPFRKASQRSLKNRSNENDLAFLIHPISLLTIPIITPIQTRANQKNNASNTLKFESIQPIPKKDKKKKRKKSNRN